ncbi:hypothetical protein GCM10012285_33330 [Streptomyces kronopolitis]|uniref:HTH luxR-type domain-containing protein n=1 Tax=Streptomyces kronopolitis TaxID=1612435 RepID=A0ABQ2JH95_9ACTN|nr:hypothetical protein GCM10012285_33330 [Streptomyces kronopolitis]
MVIIVTVLERAAELDALASMVRESLGGGRAVAVVEGPAGVGKSALLAWAAQHGHDQGLTVLQASCCAEERGLPFGAVRQLLEPAVLAAGPDERASLLSGVAECCRRVFEPDADHVRISTDPSPTSFPQIHALFMLALRLAERAPLLLLIDDVHDADPLSRQWLTYLARRLPSSRISLGVAHRMGANSAEDTLVAELRTQPGCRWLRPSPLSPRGAADWLEDALGTELEPEVHSLCRRATGGNPYVLGALADDLLRSGIPVVRAELLRLEALIARSLMHHLPVLMRRHSPSVLKVAATVAVLKRVRDMALLSDVVRLDQVAVAGAVTVLEHAGLFEPGPPWQLPHPLVAEALLAQVGEAVGKQLRAQAASSLVALGGSDTEVGDLLLATEPEGLPWRVQVLRAAAQQAMDRFDMRTAREYLARALREPPAEADRAQILARLRITEVHTNPAAADRLRTAVAEEAEPAERARLVPHLAGALTRTGHAEEAIGLLDAFAAEIPEADQESLYRLWAQGILLLLEQSPMLADMWITRGSIGQGLNGHTPGQRFLLATLALQTTLTGRGSHTAVILAEHALGRFDPPTDPMLTGAFAIMALLHADRLKEAARWYKELIANGLERQPPLLRSLVLSQRAKLAFRLGDLHSALELGREAVTLASADQRYRPYAAAQVVHALLELGDIPEATRVCRSAFEEPVGNHWSWTPLLASRAQLRLVQGQHEAALGDLEECGRRQVAGGYDNPAMAPWRSQAALIHGHFGDLATGTRLAREELELARKWGSPRTMAASLRVLGMLTTGPSALEALSEAVTLLETTQARTDLAHAVTDLGQALYEAGQTEPARARLRQALALAEASCAQPLAERAFQALLATGARPRRKRQSGIHALTDRERRIAVLAAEGMTNQQIAAELFIARRTVEFHLTRVYRKLGVDGRANLAETMTEPEQPLPQNSPAPLLP